MFFLRYIWKAAKSARWTALVGALILALLPSLALANGEAYSWTDKQQTAIQATGGSYAQAAQFNPIGNSTTKFSAKNVQVTCAGGSTGTTGEVDLTLNSGKDGGALNFPQPVTCANPNQFDLSPSITAAGTGNPSANSNNSNDGSSSCDQGDFTWIMCPVMGQISSFSATIVKDALVPFLKVNPLSATSTPELYQAWSHIRDLADVMFIVIFLVIIFSTTIGTGLDQYTVKRLLPRLVAAAILVQFSFFLSSGLVDAGNVLGAGMDNLITGVVNPSNGGHSVTNLLGEAGALGIAAAAGTGAFVALHSWPAVLPIIAGIAITLLVVFFTLAARYILIAILVTLSPLAFVAWVLPNTSRHFKAWYTALLRLVMMFPIVMGVLAIGGRINELLPFSGNEVAGSTAASVVVALVKPLIIIATFLLIPRTFKWAGEALGNVHHVIQGLHGAAQGTYKQSGFWKDGQAARAMNRNQRIMQLRDPNRAAELMASNSAVKRMRGRMVNPATRLGRASHGAGLFSAGLMYGTPSNSLGAQRTYSRLMNDRHKELEDLLEASPDNLITAMQASYGRTPQDREAAMKELGQKAPSLLNYTRTAQGRVALAQRASTFKLLNDDFVRRMMTDPEHKWEYNYIQKSTKQDFSAYPTLITPRRLDINKFENTDFNTGLASGKIRGIGAKALSDTVEESNFTSAIGKQVGDRLSNGQFEHQHDALSETIAKTWLDNLSGAAVTETFKYGTRNFMDPGKRTSLVRMLQANQDKTLTGNGLRVREAALQQLFEPATMNNPGNTDIYERLAEHAALIGFVPTPTGDPAIDALQYLSNTDRASRVKGLTTAQQEVYLRQWLNYP